jgi:hypothetical protein
MHEEAGGWDGSKIAYNELSIPLNFPILSYTELPPTLLSPSNLLEEPSIWCSELPPPNADWERYIPGYFSSKETVKFFPI